MAARNGFTPTRTPDTRYVGNFAVSAGGQPVAKGDAVIRNTGGRITAMPAGMDPGVGFGVVLAVYTTANRPLTFNTTKFITSAGVGRADVCWDPQMTYTVQCTTSIGQGDLQSRVNINASAANSLTGISGQSVTVEASASVGNPFKIINIAPFDELAGKGTGGAVDQAVEVAWNNHYLRAGN